MDTDNEFCGITGFVHHTKESRVGFGGDYTGVYGGTKFMNGKQAINSDVTIL
jgi:hypothetical protein